MTSDIIQKFSFKRKESHKNPCRIMILNSALGKLSLCDKITDQLPNFDQQVIYDPSKWKDQDHYATLHLQDKRYLATDQEIKHSYRKLILSYHPDKLKATDVSKNATSKDARFQCIQKAYEILSDPEKRRQYDSVDPSFDESIPPPMTKDQVNQNPGYFFSMYGEVFQRNARFSLHFPVPHFGGLDAPLDLVRHFYEFWYGFESRRSFEYLDEEDPAIADNRYDRRAIERANKLARQKKKSQDNARIHKLVDQARAADPRVVKLEALDKLEKEKQKEQKRMIKEQEKQKEKEERERMAAELEQQKLQVSKEKEPIVQCSVERPTEDKKPWSPEEVRLLLMAVKKIPGGVKDRWGVIRDYICDHSPDHTFRSSEAVVSKAKEVQRESDWDQLQTLTRRKIDPRIHQTTASIHPERPIASNAQPEHVQDVENDQEHKKTWAIEDQKALEEALKMFPATLQDRWDKIATFMQPFNKSKKDCMLRCKELAALIKAKTNK